MRNEHDGCEWVRKLIKPKITTLCDIWHNSTMMERRNRCDGMPIRPFACPPTTNRWQHDKMLQWNMYNFIEIFIISIIIAFVIGRFLCGKGFNKLPAIWVNGRRPHVGYESNRLWFQMEHTRCDWMPTLLFFGDISVNKRCHFETHLNTLPAIDWFAHKEGKLSSMALSNKQQSHTVSNRRL